MIYYDVKENLLALNLSDAAMREDRLLLATNLALGELYSSLPVYKTIRFAARGQKPVLYCKEKTGSPGETISFPLNGRAYSVRIHGSCQFMIDNGTEYTITTVKTGREAQLFRGLVIPGSTISFWGVYSFNIFDFSVYEMAYSEDESQIHDGSAIVSFDLRELADDFMSFVTLPRDQNGEIIKNCRLFDSKVELDATYNGEIVLTYRRLPTLITGRSTDDEIDLPAGCEHLFPYLVASYLITGTDDLMASYYRKMYDTNLEQVKVGRPDEIDPAYLNIDNWA